MNKEKITIEYNKREIQIEFPKTFEDLQFEFLENFNEDENKEFIFYYMEDDEQINIEQNKYLRLMTELFSKDENDRKIYARLKDEQEAIHDVSIDNDEKNISIYNEDHPQCNKNLIDEIKMINKDLVLIINNDKINKKNLGEDNKNINMNEVMQDNLIEKYINEIKSELKEYNNFKNVNIVGKIILYKKDIEENINDILLKIKNLFNIKNEKANISNNKYEEEIKRLNNDINQLKDENKSLDKEINELRIINYKLYEDNTKLNNKIEECDIQNKQLLNKMKEQEKNKQKENNKLDNIKKQDKILNYNLKEKRVKSNRPSYDQNKLLNIYKTTIINVLKEKYSSLLQSEIEKYNKNVHSTLEDIKKNIESNIAKKLTSKPKEEKKIENLKIYEVKDLMYHKINNKNKHPQKITKTEPNERNSNFKNKNNMKKKNLDKKIDCKKKLLDLLDSHKKDLSTPLKGVFNNKSVNKIKRLTPSKKVIVNNPSMRNIYKKKNVKK